MTDLGEKTEWQKVSDKEVWTLFLGNMFTLGSYEKDGCPVKCF